MNAYVADTHALFWYLTDSPRLGRQASSAFEEADRGSAQIYLSAIVLAELFYMNEKLGRPLDFVAIVLPDDVSITIRVIDGREPRVAGDMQVFSDLQVGDDIVVQRAPFRSRFLHPPGHSHYATLRGKLNWHELPTLQKR